jgi:hypothetical protein
MCLLWFKIERCELYIIFSPLSPLPPAIVRAPAALLVAFLLCPLPRSTESNHDRHMIAVPGPKFIIAYIHRFQPF